MACPSPRTHPKENISSCFQERSVWIHYGENRLLEFSLCICNKKNTKKNKSLRFIQKVKVVCACSIISVLILFYLVSFSVGFFLFVCLFVFVHSPVFRYLLAKWKTNHKQAKRVWTCWESLRVSGANRFLKTLHYNWTQEKLCQHYSGNQTQNIFNVLWKTSPPPFVLLF